MDKLITSLKERYEFTITKIGRDFLFGICNYFDLLNHPDLQDILKKQKELPNGHYQKFFKQYEALNLKVVQPMKTKPEEAEKRFSGFYRLEESDRKDLLVLSLNVFSWKALFWDRVMHKQRLMDIHNKLIVLLENKELLKPTPPPIKRMAFDQNKSVLYLNEFEIPIIRHGSITDEHRLLSFIFNYENLGQEFFYADMAEDITGEEYQNNPRKYWDICNAINDKVANGTKGLCSKFLIANLSKSGLVKINPECWQLFR